jgi:hypothetical protein
MIRDQWIKRRSVEIQSDDWTSCAQRLILITAVLNRGRGHVLHSEHDHVTPILNRLSYHVRETLVNRLLVTTLKIEVMHKKHRIFVLTIQISISTDSKSIIAQARNVTSEIVGVENLVSASAIHAKPNETWLEVIDWEKNGAIVIRSGTLGVAEIVECTAERVVGGRILLVTFVLSNTTCSNMCGRFG